MLMSFLLCLFFFGHEMVGIDCYSATGKGETKRLRILPSRCVLHILRASYDVWVY
jgi:hypothetical protein